MPDRAGRTPLHYAALNNDVAGVARALSAGTAPDVADVQGFTPLHLAAQAYARDAARELVGAGANVNALNQWRNGPLFVAVVHSRGRGELIALLRASGADPFASNVSGQTPLGLARLIDNYDVAQFFADLDDC